MAFNVHQLLIRRSKAQEKALLLRAEYWPEVGDDQLWYRKRHDGFTTIPRTMAMIMNIIDSLSKNKPAGYTYFVLWCRAWDESLLVIDNPSALAAESGFSSERAITTWKQRMTTLQNLGFIDAKAGTTGAFHYVLIYNPHVVVWKLKDQIPQKLFRQLYDRAIDIGAKDVKQLSQPAPPASKSSAPRSQSAPTPVKSRLIRPKLSFTGVSAPGARPTPAKALKK